MSEAAFIPLAEPLLMGNAERYVQECLASNFVSSVGPFVSRFETEFAASVGAKHAVACASGTAALHVALRLLDMQPGDEVWVSDLTFIASANPILYERATPVLVDAEPDTWNCDPAPMLAEIRRRAHLGLRQPAAIMPVHLLGQPADLRALADLSAEHGIPLIEDAAEALGARYVDGPHVGRQVGTIGTVGCFSFNGNKLITTGGGGMLVTDDPALARRAKHLTTQARLPGPAYAHDEVGYNYRLTNLAAALGVAQLEVIDELLARKAAIAQRYDQALDGDARITLSPRPNWALSSHWLYSIQLNSQEERDSLMRWLDGHGIQARPLWTPLHRMPMYAQAQRLGGHHADTLADCGLSLPCSAGLSPGEQARVVAGIKAWLDNGT